MSSTAKSEKGGITLSKLLALLFLLGVGYFVWKIYIVPYSKLLSFQSFLLNEAGKAHESTDYEIMERISKEAKALGFILSPEDVRIERGSEKTAIVATVFYQVKIWNYTRSIRKEVMAVRPAGGD